MSIPRSQSAVQHNRSEDPMNAQLQPAATPTGMPNPLGIHGFEFVEFAAPDAAGVHALFRSMGFTAIARHRSRAITLYRQGGVNFLVNEEPDSFASGFAAQHGPCACGFAIRVRDGDEVHAEVVSRGADDFADRGAKRAVDAPVIRGIGDCMLYLATDGIDPFAEDYVFFDDVDREPVGFGLTFIDHLTHNLYFGNMEKWATYYEKLFGFREIRYFDIKGAKTGLVSKAMTAPDGIVRIPLNESSDPKSQINEYLDQYHGEGIQHIACFTENIYDTVEAMRASGVNFLHTPDTYFDVIDERVPNHGEDVARMRANRILIDADPETKTKKLLQIFTETNIGPIFFEIIQRKGNEGFGEGNFKALFESIEADQMRRGVL
jgi:4-hydroxyphenylpyruvate dioxygenase